MASQDLIRTEWILKKERWRWKYVLRFKLFSDKRIHNINMTNHNFWFCKNLLVI